MSERRQGGGDGRRRRRPEISPKPFPRRRRGGPDRLRMGVSRNGSLGRGAGAGKRFLEEDAARSPLNKGIRNRLLAKELRERHAEQAVDHSRGHGITNEPEGGVSATGPNKTMRRDTLAPGRLVESHASAAAQEPVTVRLTEGESRALESRQGSGGHGAAQTTIDVDCEIRGTSENRITPPGGVGTGKAVGDLGDAGRGGAVSVVNRCGRVEETGELEGLDPGRRGI